METKMKLWGKNEINKTKSRRQVLYEEVVQGLDLSDGISDEAIYENIDRVLLKETRTYHLSLSEKCFIRQALFSAVRKLDILSDIMEDENITEVMVNGSNNIFVEQDGEIVPYKEGFTTEEKLTDVIQKIAAVINRRVNESSPMVDARLEDGSRVNIVLPPIALDGPAVTIRRFPKEAVSMEQLISWGSISREAAEYLRVLVECRYNIFVSGGTGAGKTTLLGALAEYIPEKERVITIEDSAELRLRNVKNIVRLETRPENLEGNYGISIRDLIRNALRMRPDRIIVGEIRSEEALDMLQAMNTGHDGSLSTGHANSAADMLSRMETMVLMGMNLPLEAVRSQIASGIDILVHIGRLRDRSRKILGIYEIIGIENGQIKTQPLFEFKEEGEDEGGILGTLKKSGFSLEHREKLEAGGGKLQ